MRIKQQYIYPLLMGLVIIVFYVYENYQPSPASEKTEGTATNTFYLPVSTTHQVVYHKFYTLSYNEFHEQAEWVAYELKRAHLSNADRKRPYFYEDPKVATGSADWRNYKNSGYERGHLCPAGDRRFSLDAYNETFYTSNISPMLRAFNSGIWNRLEQQTRYWAKKYDGVYVVTGGILKPKKGTIGKEKVTVPASFYKIVLDNRNGSFKLLGFLIPHRESNEPLENYVVSVDSIEELTGIDFFPNLPDDQEIKEESQVDINAWGW
jgi:endonuclease G